MTPSLTQGQIDAILRAFVLSILPAGVEMTTAQQNLVAEPQSDNFVLSTLLSRTRLGTNVQSWDESAGGNPATLSNSESVSISMQLDFHGADSTDNAQVFATLFRSQFAVDYMGASGLFPDYCTDGRQMPFINGEDQYEDRWVINAVFDCNMNIETPQQFADVLKINSIVFERSA